MTNTLSAAGVPLSPEAASLNATFTSYTNTFINTPQEEINNFVSLFNIYNTTLF